MGERAVDAMQVAAILEGLFPERPRRRQRPWLLRRPVARHAHRAVERLAPLQGGGIQRLDQLHVIHRAFRRIGRSLGVPEGGHRQNAEKNPGITNHIR